MAPATLIVTADDFGIGQATSAGIIRAHLEGPVTCTSLMVGTGDHVLRSLPLLERAPRLVVGLHLVLTGASAPLGNLRGSGLVNRDGVFHGMGRLMLQAMAGRISQPAAFDEIARQAEMFRKLLGRAPAYVDAHHHAHQLPGSREALLGAMDSALLPRLTRISLEPPGFLRRIRGSRLRRVVASRLGRSAREFFAANNIRFNDWFFGMISAGDVRREFPWDRYMPHLPATGAVEWVVHPGEADETLNGRDSYTWQRARELEALVAAGNRKWWEGRRLVTKVQISET